MRDVVFISLEDWDDVWRRNQFFCAELAERHPSSRILFVTPPRDVSNAIRRRDCARLRARSLWSPAGLPNITVFSPIKLYPSTIAIGRRFNAWGLRRQLRRTCCRVGIERPILWINDHAAETLVGQLDEVGVVYDITDDWISFEQPEAIRERTRAQDSALCKAADATVVCSKRLLEMKLELVGNERLHLIPNGVDAAHYASVHDRTLPIAAAARAWPRPVFGYTGTVHPDRVDVELIGRLAATLREGVIVLVGPNHLPAAHRAKLEATGGVIVAGAVPYADIPATMRAFDVCIVPHRMTPFTESLNPIKLWEYLAAGKPIVSTDVAGFRDFPRLVRVARDATSFAAAMADAIREDDERVVEARRSEARGQSWASRVDQIERVLAEAAIRAEVRHRC